MPAARTDSRDYPTSQFELDFQHSELPHIPLGLESALNRYTDLYDSAPIGCFTLDRDGTIAQANLYGARMLGSQGFELGGVNLGSFVADESQAAFRKLLSAALDETAPVMTEVKILPSTGAPIWVRIDAQTDDSARGLQVIVVDITERKQAEDQLRAAKAEAERANNAKSRFLAAASHDLRQPLAALNLYVGVLGYKLAPEDSVLLKNMKDCVASLSEMLNDLLDLSKLEAGVVTPEICDFALSKVLSNVVSVHAPEAQSKGLSLRCTSTSLTARTDPVLFRRILGNLVSNAIRYTEHGGVLVGCRRRFGKTWVEVWDTGIGIPEDKTLQIFEEFRQLGNDARNRAKGSGLGLAIVAKAAALLGLEIRVRSRPGKGSMFAIEVPLGLGTLTDVERQFTQRPLRIALVEDDALVVEALVYALGEVGHQVLAAATGREILAQLDRQAPDVVVSDYRLAAGETGFDVITAVREAFGSKVPALLITGDTDPQLIRSMVSQGIRVQHKPIELDALQLCIAELLEQREAVR